MTMHNHGAFIVSKTSDVTLKVNVLIKSFPPSLSMSRACPLIVSSSTKRTKPAATADGLEEMQMAGLCIDLRNPNKQTHSLENTAWVN